MAVPSATAPQSPRQPRPSSSAGRGADVLFAVMPFADLGRPAIGVSLLQAELDALGISSSIRYFNFDLAESIGLDVYRTIAGSFPPDSLIGEWFFADLLFGTSLPDEEEYLDRILSRYGNRTSFLPRLREARKARAAFVEESAEAIRAAAPAIVGFTTAFHQTCACLAVAERLKRLPSSPVVVFGGANCEGEMGLQLVRSFECVDYACTQEGDSVFPAFVHGLLTGDGPEPPPGIVSRRDDEPASAPELVTDLDGLPIPVYSDYFERHRRSPLASEVPAEVLVETSRGCWWGAKKHCTFCGLNGSTMAFRAKSPERVFEELRFLRETYGIPRIESVDNILDLRYIGTLFPRLAESGLDLELFYEVKANLRRDQLVTLKAGGLSTIQPGIESFSSVVLDLMAKGCTGFQNVQLLRWCEELGLTVAWNLLYGFPGEPPSEYERMADLVPLLAHLQAPASCSAFRLDRFSPFYTRGDELGIAARRPAHAYYYVFPFGRGELSRLAYYFDFDFADDCDPESYTRRLSLEVSRWWAAFTAGDRPVLEAEEDRGDLVITDTRPCAVAREHRLQGLEAEIYRRCDVAQPLAALGQRFAGRWPEPAVAAALERLVGNNLTAEIDGRYVSLALMRERTGSEGA